ncbi:DUF3429 domain-containing protein [Paraferrimonas sedimenticola]|uniref:DUF3429 domain-containing protein n=1 Tax=Paraferrimonas sedimenticola TaxID=375674 RepID=A0AA37RYQ2_9GAMM|nr:DUF3429 domain-containing protein [Paraferrimonas sedimenticola]GLP97409.1 hypothetical protein GCM10007895_27160 [Paraferrimonas sedimenticola]
MNSYRVLGYLGITPMLFILAAIIWQRLWPADTQLADQAVTDWLLHAFLMYSGLILAFMGGTLWAPNAQPKPAKWEPWLAVLPTFMALIAVLLDSLLSLAILTTGYTAILAIEMGRPRWGEYASWYQNLRFTLSLWVVMAHLAMGFIV